MLAPSAVRVKELRDKNQISLQEAKKLAWGELLLERLNNANEVYDLKPIIELLILDRFGKP